MNEDGYPVKVQKLFAHQKEAADRICREFFEDDAGEAGRTGFSPERNDGGSLPQSAATVPRSNPRDSTVGSLP